MVGVLVSGEKPVPVLAFCKLCNAELRQHEVKEGVCDQCLRKHQTR